MGTLFIMWTCELFGRRANIQIGAFLSMFGGALQAGANSIEYGFTPFNSLGHDETTQGNSNLVQQNVPSWSIYLWSWHWFFGDCLSHVSE